MLSTTLPALPASVKSLCPDCRRLVITEGFHWHPCRDGECIVTINGALHSIARSALEARTIIYRATARHTAAGITTAQHIEHDAYDIWYDDANDALERGEISSLLQWPGMADAVLARQEARR